MNTIALGAVHLNVNNMDLMKAYYEHLGLRAHRLGGVVILYGGDFPLLVLHETYKTRKHEVGLYHFAIKVPSREDLGNILYHLAKEKIPVTGFSDHHVSEAIYLQDPEGNGIEIYHDRPKELWLKRGQIHMSTEPMDVQEVLKSRTTDDFLGFPLGTHMGHIHLHVLDLEASEAFYENTLGLEKVFTYPNAGFYSRDGYHHHVAMNLWLPGDPSQKEDRYPGLHAFSIHLEEEVYDDLFPDQSTQKELRDPSNLLVKVHRGLRPKELL